MTGWSCIDTSPSKGQGSYVWIFLVSPASWGFGAGEASGSQGMSASSEHEGVSKPWSVSLS